MHPVVAEPEHDVHRYRPRVEGAFARIERWVERTTAISHWRVWSRDDVLSIFGQDPQARIAHPRRPERVFEWLLERVQDDRGNVTTFSYKAEDLVGVAASSAFERERLRVGEAPANHYLKRIRYGNRVPERAEDFAFEVVFDYGEHGERGLETVAVSPDESQPWPARADPFSNHRATFELRTWRLCRRVLMFHHFPDELGAPFLVRSTDLEHDEQPTAALLQRVIQRGYSRVGEPSEQRYRHAAWPALTLEYAPLEIGRVSRTIDGSTLATVSGPIDGRRVRLRGAAKATSMR